MPNVFRNPASMMAFIVSSLLLAPEAIAGPKNDRLQIYAGPQSVSPRDDIHVTVELADLHGNSVNNQNVNLSYTADGIPTMLEGNVQNGLVSFDVIAQQTAGKMDFIARAEGLVSNAAPVIIVAAEPAVFGLSAKPSRIPGRVDIMSEKIVDTFGNLITDQNLVALSWVDSGGITGFENTQLLNSRIILNRSCPENFIAPLRLRAVVKNTEVKSKDLSSLCADGEA